MKEYYICRCRFMWDASKKGRPLCRSGLQTFCIPEWEVDEKDMKRLLKNKKKDVPCPTCDKIK